MTEVFNLQELRDLAENAGGAPFYVGDRLRPALLAFVNLAEAARPLARLPFPLSSDERAEWREHRQRLIEALAPFNPKDSHE